MAQISSPTDRWNTDFVPPKRGQTDGAMTEQNSTRKSGHASICDATNERDITAHNIEHIHNCHGEVGFQILPSTSRSPKQKNAANLRLSLASRDGSLPRSPGFRGLVATEPAKKHIAQLAVKESPERRRNRDLLLRFELNSNKTEKFLQMKHGLLHTSG